MKKMIVLLFLSACSSFHHLPDKKNYPDKLTGWWERYYPVNDEPSGSWNLTHIEFMNDGECRYNIGSYEGEKYYMTAYNNAKWKNDSTNQSKILIFSPYAMGPDFFISVINIDKSNLVFQLTIQEFNDTVYMKKWHC